MSNSELQHYGVLGMKWGRRKAQGSSSGGKGGRKTKPKNQTVKDSKRFCENSKIMKKKYNVISREEFMAREIRARKMLTALSVMSLAAGAYVITKM